MAFIQTPVQTPITGKERLSPDTPLGALAEFYRAFNTCDLELMAQNWQVEGDIAMDNPLGGIRRGWSDIKAGYEHIFLAPDQVAVAFVDYTMHDSSDLFYAVGRERGALHSADTRLDLEFRTTRIFRRCEARWRQVHHHGSIDEPRLLQDYQAIIAQLAGERRRL